MATLTWAALDDAAPGDPSAYAGLASDFAATADDARSARALLERFGASVDPSVWRGEAAEAFKDDIGKLPPKLAKLADSYAKAAEGMATYGRVLEDLQAQARRLGDQAQAAESERMAAEAARDSATATDPAAPTAAYDDAVDRARRRASTLERELDHLRDRRRAAENAAIRALDRAHDLGIKNDSFLKRAWGAVERWVDDHAGLLRGISTGLKWISAAAGLLSFIPVLAPICAPIALAAGGAALLMDAALAASGRGSWKSFAVDAVLMALPGAGRLASRAVNARHAVRAGEAVRAVRPAARGPQQAAGEMFRRATNIGVFHGLPEPMQLRHVRRTASDAGIGLKGVRVHIDRNPELIGKDLFGHTAPNGRITLYPDAFRSREELIRTLGHERMHVYQTRTFGPATTNPELGLREAAARASEDMWWAYAQSVGAG